MTHTVCHMSISMDGFVAGPHQGPDDPLGVGGLRLHEWHWDADAPVHEQDVAMRDDLMAPRGAYVMGRNMFGPIRGSWEAGASTVRQALAAGVVDELVLDVVPLLLGTGERLFDGVSDPGFTPVEVVSSPRATHVRYRIGVVS